MLTNATIQQQQDKLSAIVATIRGSVQRHAQRQFKQTLQEESAFGQVTAERADLDSIIPSNPVALGHVLWMCNEVDGFIREQRFDKANRWIGFMQAIQWLTGVASINESRDVNEREMKPCATCGKLGHRPMDHAGWDPTKEGHG